MATLDSEMSLLKAYQKSKELKEAIKVDIEVILRDIETVFVINAQEKSKLANKIELFMRTHKYEDRQNMLVNFEELKSISCAIRGEIIDKKNGDNVNEYKNNLRRLKKEVERALSVKLKYIVMIDNFISE